MVYTVKKKKKKAEEMRVFLHGSYVIFTKATDSTEERGISKHRTFEYLCSIKVRPHIYHIVYAYMFTMKPIDQKSRTFDNKKKHVHNLHMHAVMVPNDAVSCTME